MKHTRKLITLLLALVVVLSLSVTAFATGETTGTITIDNPVYPHGYTAYKIFDVTYDTKTEGGETVTGDHYAYSIDSGSEWFSTVQTYAADTTHGLTLTAVAGTTTYIVDKTDDFSAPAFANTLKANIAGKTGTPLTIAEGYTVATATGLELGYYFVTSTSGALCNLTTTNPTVTIHDKNNIPFLKTDDKDWTVEIGEVVNYVITGKVPDTTGFETYMYQITDTMTDGLTFHNNVKVYIDGTELTTGFTLKTGADAGDKDFVLDIDVMKLTFGAEIEVRYSATVNENAAGNNDRNEAILEYSNDPTDSTKTKTQRSSQDVYSAKIVVDKYAVNPNDPDDKSTKLAGAKFKLYKEETTIVDGTSTTTKLYYKYTAATATESAKVEWVDVGQATEVTTDRNGAASFLGLKDGTYYLEETAAPAGYNKLTNSVAILIDGKDGGTFPVFAKLTHTEQVGNNTGTMLPTTGGMGTTVFYVVGSILLVGAAVLLVTKKRMSAAK